MTYRKNRREYFAIEGETVTRVLNKHYGCLIETTKNPIVMCNAVAESFECTEQEFNDAYNHALTVVSMKKVL